MTGHNVDTLEVDKRTLVWDIDAEQQVMWINGHLNLPIGSVIQLAAQTDPRVGEATVSGVTLLAGSPERSVTVRLDCKVSKGWEKHYLIASES